MEMGKGAEGVGSFCLGARGGGLEKMGMENGERGVLKGWGWEGFERNEGSIVIPISYLAPALATRFRKP